MTYNNKWIGESCQKTVTSFAFSYGMLRLKSNDFRSKLVSLLQLGMTKHSILPVALIVPISAWAIDV